MRDAAAVRLGAKGHGGAEVSGEVGGETWEHVTVEFTTGATSMNATAFVVKTGEGTAFADDLGLLLVAGR